jgi:hypothetical protein
MAEIQTRRNGANGTAVLSSMRKCNATALHMRKAHPIHVAELHQDPSISVIVLEKKAEPRPGYREPTSPSLARSALVWKHGKVITQWWVPPVWRWRVGIMGRACEPAKKSGNPGLSAASRREVVQARLIPSSSIQADQVMAKKHLAVTVNLVEIRWSGVQPNSHRPEVPLIV